MLNAYELLIQTLSIAIQANIPVHVQGMPGIGKTKIFEMISRSLNAYLHVLIGSITDPSDYSGLPWGDENSSSARMLPKDWAIRINALSNQLAILFLDELTTSSPMVQAAMLRVACDRWVGDLKLADHVRIVAASNPPEIAASGQDLAPPLANRFMHLEYEADHNIWADGIVMGFPDVKLTMLPTYWREGIPQTRVRVASFIKAGGREKLIALPKSSADQAKAWPSARTWDMAIIALAAADSIGASRQVRSNVVQGLVGHGVAMEFLEYEENLNLPNPEDVLRDPYAFKLPKESDRAYAAANSIMAAVIQNNTKDRWTAGMIALVNGAQGREDIVTQPTRVLLTPPNKPEGATLPKEFQDMRAMFVAAGMIPARKATTAKRAGSK